MASSRRNQIDGGYGWVVVAASFVCHAITDGCVFSVGVLYSHLLEAFQESKSKTSLIGSLFLGLSLLFGTASSFLVERFGCRKVTLAGGIIAGIGYTSSAFAPSINVLCVTYGIIAALGISMIYVPALVIVSMYFEKKRSLATGIAVCGAGIGTLIFPPLCEILIQEYRWQGMLLIMGGIVTNFCVCGALFKPIELCSSQSTDSKENESISDMARPCDTNDFREKSREDAAKSFKIPDRFHRGNPLYLYRGCRAGILFSSTPSIMCAEDKSIRFRDCSPVKNNKSKEYLSKCDYSVKTSCPGKTELTQSCPELRKMNADLLILPFDSESSNDTRRKSIFSRTIYTPVKLFYQDVINSKSSVWLVLFMIHNFVLYFWIDIPYMFVVDRAIILGIESTWASFLISIVGISSTLGQLLSGVLGDKSSINTSVLYSVSVMISGITVSVIPFCKTYATMATMAAIFGFFIAANYTLCTVLLIEQLGLRALAVAYGIIMLFQGIGNTVGPPTAGLMFDILGTYDESFYVAGVFIFLSGLLTVLLPVAQYLKSHSVKKYCHCDNQRLNIT